MLDYSIENFGFDIAWHLFREDLAAFNINVPFDVRYWLLKSRFTRGDVDGYMQQLVDWKLISKQNVARFLEYRFGKRATEPPPIKVRKILVTKWVPGDHYHAMGERYNTVQQAIDAIAAAGHQYAGFQERFVYESLE